MISVSNGEYTPLDNLGITTVNKNYVPADKFGAVLAERKRGKKR